MAQDTPKIYQQKTLEFIRGIAPKIQEYAIKSGIAPSVIVNLIAEEYDDVAQKSIGGQFINWGLDNYVWGRSFYEGHAGIAANYNLVRSAEFDGTVRNDPGPQDKASNVTLADLGPSNIKLMTAIDVLKDYQEGDVNGTDPLGLASYYNRYDLLARDLANGKADTVVAITALVAKERELRRNGNSGQLELNQPRHRCHPVGHGLAGGRRDARPRYHAPAPAGLEERRHGVGGRSDRPVRRW